MGNQAKRHTDAPSMDTTTTNYLSDLPLTQLRQILAQTEDSAGAASQGARIIRRIIAEQERAEPHLTQGDGVRFVDPTLVGERQTHGAQIGRPVDRHRVPEWFRLRLVETLGVPRSHQSRGCLVDWVRNTCGATWLDHWGTVSFPNGEEVFVSEPYHLTPVQMQNIAKIAEATGCDVWVTATSSWYPTKTLRSEFWQKRKEA